MTTNEKILNDIKLALGGNPNHTWNYIHKLLEQLGYSPSEDDDRQGWAIGRGILTALIVALIAGAAKYFGFMPNP